MNPWLHEPGIGKAIWDLTLAMTANASLPDPVRQIVILVVGARFDAAYEIYAHIAVAEREGMTEERLATWSANLKPGDLSAQESIAFDVAYALGARRHPARAPLPAVPQDLRPAFHQ